MSTKKKRPTVNRRATAAAVAAPPAVAVAAETPSAVARMAFQENRKIDATVKEYSSASSKKSLAQAKLAEKHFETWSPSNFGVATREGRNYLGPRDSLGQALARVRESGVKTLRDGTDKRVLKVKLDDELKKLIKPAEPDAAPGIIGTIQVVELFGLLFPKLTLPSLKNEPNLTECQMQAKAEAWLKAVEGKVDPTTGPNPSAAPAANRQLTTRELVDDKVNILTAPMTAPEMLPTLIVPKRATVDDAGAALQTFELRTGASDVTSYHDFNSIQIAFEHVWTELFDERLKGLGARVYHRYIEQLDKLGLPVDKRSPITSVGDIKRLIADIKQLSGVPGTSTAPKGLLDQALDAIFGNKSDGAQRPAEPAVQGADRLSELLADLEKLLAENYSFTVFAADSFNFGIMVTYRQRWTPENYQVGDLVSTIPLAPREVRRYTTKRVSKKTRSVKELEDNLRTTRTESSSTSRVEREILSRAEEKSNFHLGAKESFGGEGYQIDATQDQGGDQAKISADTKKNFHEAVLKSAQEYRQQNRMEIDTSVSDESEETTFHEIQNPNDELTVTYLFYELQRTYRIQEKIHQIRPIILVANEVPKPDAIDDAWLMAHDWILRRVILDDSFRSALEYLTKSFVGAELNIQLLNTNAKAHKKIADDIKAQIAVQTALVDRSQNELANQVKTVAGIQIGGSILNTVKRIFDPLQITGDAAGKTVEGAQTLVDFAQQAVDRAEREKWRLSDQLGVATTALQTAIDKLSAAVKEHYDRVTEIDRLRIHVKANILYYMQAIWNHEPPDQRYFRVYNIDVSIVEPDPNATVNVTTATASSVLDTLIGNQPGNELHINIPQVKVTKKKLVELADLDTVLGYKGNYAIYALKENNLVTAHMMQNYIEMSGHVKLRDPDDFANYSVDELKEWAACLYKRDKTTYDKHKTEFTKLIVDRLKSGRPEDDRVVVPTTSLYIEALVGTHPLLEDFKLAHRALDVRKAQADARHAELENVRLAARAMEAQYEDPDIEKKIVIEGGAAAVIPGD